MCKQEGDEEPRSEPDVLPLSSEWQNRQFTYLQELDSLDNSFRLPSPRRLTTNDVSLQLLLRRDNNLPPVSV